MSGQDQIRVLTAETAQLRLQLATANKRAEVAEAEVAELLQRVRTLELQASVHNAYLERIRAASNPAW